MSATVLNGITWGHSRGITPLLAASQRYSELNPGTEIRWKKRTLQEFADYPIEKLTTDYDLLIIDHPWVGCAAATRCVLPLESHLHPAYLADQQEHSLGRSHESYFYGDSQWALAIDAATPAASFRRDLFQQHSIQIPETWEDVLSLARKGRIAVPAIPIDLLMTFYSFCIAHGAEPFASEEEVIDTTTGLQAIDTMLELYTQVDKKMFTCNPIAVAELMTSADDYLYCPFAYCYSNYSREGYARTVLEYAEPVYFSGSRLRTTIGGTGLSVSAFSKHKEIAVDFARFVVSADCQRTMYVQHGGQPGHRAAWTDPAVNKLTNNFFRNVLPVMDNGYMRPRYNGYLFFQDHAGDPLQQCLMQKKSAPDALEQMNEIYRKSFQKRQTTTVTV